VGGVRLIWFWASLERGWGDWSVVQDLERLDCQLRLLEAVLCRGAVLANYTTTKDPGGCAYI